MLNSVSLVNKACVGKSSKGGILAIAHTLFGSSINELTIETPVVTLEHHPSNQDVMYNTSVIPIFLYGSETWPLTWTLTKQFDVSNAHCPRMIEHIRCQNHITNEEV